MPSWIPHIDILSLILGTILGTFASTWYNYYVKKPKLLVNGASSGGGTLGHSNSISLTNQPGFLGLRLPETIVFGKTIHNSFELFGVVIDRDPANQCRAWLIDKETNEPIRPLWWRGPDHQLTQEVTIKSGERADLIVFARLDSEPLKYFVYQPREGSQHEFEVPPDHLKFDATKEFVIKINHSYGRKGVMIPCKMIKGYERLNFTFGREGSGTF